VEILKQLHEVVHIKRPELCPNGWILHCGGGGGGGGGGSSGGGSGGGGGDGNDKALSVKQFLDQKSITEM